MNTELARFNMIEQQIRPWDVLDQSVLSLLAIVKREDFVPAAYQALAFVDTEVPLPGGQSMLAPKVEARLLQELAVQKHERVLEVGTGSGFMAALLGHKAQHVTTLETLPELAALARANLQRAAVMNVKVVEGDGAHGRPSDGPFDVIVLSGSVPEVPPTLLDQLKPGGRLVAVVGQLPIMCAVLFTRGSERGFGSVELFDTVAPRLTGFDEPTRFRFLVQKTVMQQIAVQDLQAFVAAKAGAGNAPLLLDVREPWEFALAALHVDGAQTLNLPMGEIPGRQGELDPAQPVVCICHHGMRSAQVVAFLLQQGHTAVYNLAGGIDAWSTQVDPRVPRY